MCLLDIHGANLFVVDLKASCPNTHIKMSARSKWWSGHDLMMKGHKMMKWTCPLHHDTNSQDLCHYSSATSEITCPLQILDDGSWEKWWFKEALSMKQAKNPKTQMMKWTWGRDTNSQRCHYSSATSEITCPLHILDDGSWEKLWFKEACRWHRPRTSSVSTSSSNVSTSSLYICPLHHQLVRRLLSVEVDNNWQGLYTGHVHFQY